MTHSHDHSEQFTIPFVKALILAPGRDRFLLQRRAKDDPYRGYWELPGGKMRLGETAEQALRREALEEAGIEIREVLGQRFQVQSDIFGRTARLLRPLATVEIASGPWPYLGHYFACLAVGTPAATAEGDSHRWVTPAGFRREFLESETPGQCTTLDLVAMRYILQGNKLDLLLQAEPEDASPS